MAGGIVTTEATKWSAILFSSLFHVTGFYQRSRRKRLRQQPAGLWWRGHPRAPGLIPYFSQDCTTSKPAPPHHHHTHHRRKFSRLTVTCDDGSAPEYSLWVPLNDCLIFLFQFFKNCNQLLTTATLFITSLLIIIADFFTNQMERSVNR